MSRLDQPDQRVQQAIAWCGDAQCLATAQDVTIQMIDFAGFAARQILGQSNAHVLLPDNAQIENEVFLSIKNAI